VDLILLSGSAVERERGKEKHRFPQQRCGMGRGRGKGGFYDMLGELGGMMQAACCCVCMLFILGPVFLIIGLSFLADATTDTRGEALAELEADAAEWTDGRRAEFDGLELSIRVGQTEPSITVTSLPAVASGDVIADIGSQPEDVEISWTPLRYSAVVPVPGHGAPGDTYTLLAGAEGSTIELDQTGPFVLCEQSFIELSNCGQSCSSSRRRSSSTTTQSQSCTSTCCPCATRCTQSGGTYTSIAGTYRCIVTMQLQEICMVAPSGAGANQPDMTASINPALWFGRTTGFAPTLPDVNDQLTNEKKLHSSAGTYARVPANTCPTSSPPSVRVTVRSADDPCVLTVLFCVVPVEFFPRET
jgi:hypothetical protein